MTYKEVREIVSGVVTNLLIHNALHKNPSVLSSMKRGACTMSDSAWQHEATLTSIQFNLETIHLLYARWRQF